MKSKLNYFDTYILRAPLLSLEQLSFYLSSRQSLIKAFGNSIIKEAIFIASPQLYFELEKWEQGKLNERESLKVEISFTKYLIRGACRATPFGTFAGCGIFKNSFEISKVARFNSEDGIRKLRFDMQFLIEIFEYLNEDYNFKIALKYKFNNTIYKVDNEFRFIEFKKIGSNRKYIISSLNSNDIIQQLMSEFSNFFSFDDFRKFFEKFEFSDVEISDFFLELIDSQVILSELNPSAIGDFFQSLFIDKINEINSERVLSIKPIINEIFDLINFLSEKKVGTYFEKYLEINQLIQLLPERFHNFIPFQVDLKFLPTNYSFNPIHFENIREVVYILSNLKRPSINLKLKNFHEKFIEKFGDLEVPLSEALDPDFGITYSEEKYSIFEPLIKNIPTSKGKFKDQIPWSWVDTFLLEKYIKCIESQSKVFEIDPDELNFENLSKERFPDSFSVMASLLEIDDKEYVYTSLVGGMASALNLIGRFCHLDESILNFGIEINNTEIESLNNIIYAEINHLPNSKLGNVLCRPKLRNFEISYLSSSNGDSNNSILISDLYLKSINNELVLFSKKLSKQIIPRMSNAHNFSFNSLPVYHFLCDYQNHKIKGNFNFGWGPILSDCLFTPRVIYKNVIIDLATWKFRKKDFSALLSNFNSYEALKEWKEKFNLPNLVLFKEGDNELLIDFSNKLSCNVFYSLIKSKNEFKLLEFLESSTPLKNEMGHSVINEIIISFCNQEKEIYSSLDFNSPKPATVQRKFAIGSEWLFFKVYGGANNLDEVICDYLLPIYNHLYSQKLILKMFFIRYQDPEDHIRLRFLTTSSSYFDTFKFISSKLNELLSKRKISNFLMDTYFREINRYKFDFSDLAESLFYFDSLGILKALNHIGPFRNERWMVSLISIDGFLTSLKLSIEIKIEIVKIIFKSFESEFGINKEFLISLDKKYRNYKGDVENLFFNKSVINSFFNERNRLISDNKEFFYLKKELDIPLIGSLLHMSVNRIFVSKGRLNEVVSYYFLLKIYHTIKALENVNK